MCTIYIYIYIRVCIIYIYMHHSCIHFHKCFRMVMCKHMVTRLLSTREKSIKIEHLTWYLQCFACIIIPGPELQKYAKLVIHSEQRGGLVFLVLSVDELVYVFPQAGINDFVISVFQGMWHEFFSHIQDLSRNCVPAHLALPLTLQRH